MQFFFCSIFSYDIYNECFKFILNLVFVSITDMQGWGVSPRGAGFLFGSDVVNTFCQENEVDLICRAHQLVMEGYKWHFGEMVLTVWSAPNYCYRSGYFLSVL